MAATIGSWPACETARARRGPGTMRSISAISTWICVSAAISRRERAASAIAMWKRASASRKGANSPTACSAAAAASSHGAAIGLAGAFGCERRRLARDCAPPIGQLAQRAASRRLSVQDERSRRVVAHERAAGAPAPRLDEARVAQDLQCLAEGHRSDAELCCELELGRQPLARREHARADGLAEAADDLLDGALGLERRERDVASGHDLHLNTITSR